MGPVNERGCYCGGWDTAPDHMRSAGHEPGHCGTCERCGSPGHTRRHPGPLPYTGAWSDACYQLMRFNWPLRYPAGVVPRSGGRRCAAVAPFCEVTPGTAGLSPTAAPLALPAHAEPEACASPDHMS